MKSPLIMQWEPNNLRRSKRERISFRQTVTITEGGATRKVVLHFQGHTKAEVRKVTKWAVTARPVRSNDRARGFVHYKCVPAGKKSSIQVNRITLDPSGAVCFVPLKAEKKDYGKKFARQMAEAA